jgi:hypothetical protein
MPGEAAAEVVLRNQKNRMIPATTIAATGNHRTNSAVVTSVFSSLIAHLLPGGNNASQLGWKRC